MTRILATLAVMLTMAFGTAAHAVDGRGLTDGSVYDHKGVSPYEPRVRQPRARVKPAPEGDHKYIQRCYWSVKTTDGWWPTGATQTCVHERID